VKITASLVCLTVGLAIVSCDPKGPGKSAKAKDRSEPINTSPTDPTSGTTPDEEMEPLSEGEWPRPLLNKVDDVTFGRLLCEKGPEAIAKGGKANLNNVFKYVCNQKSPTKIIGQLFSSAYDGANTPSVKTIYFDVNDYFVTRFVYGYAVKSKLSSPAKFSGLPVYEELGKGVISGDSLVYIKKTAERSFPGRGVVTEINLSYDLPYASGSGLYDKRDTQMNTYLLNEATQDINITVEHLLNEDNKIYQASNSLIVGVKGEPGETYLVYVVELILTNRFDPSRVKRTLIDLAKTVQETVYRVSQSGE
jgi:hypothetical protein